MPDDVSARLVAAATEAGLTLATAESLTAGRVAATVADVPGASAVLRGGVVSYAVDVKHSVLGVDAQRLAEHGPVDPVVAEQMAAGARRVCGADLGVSTTGVAGPEAHGGQEVGTVWIGVSSAAGTRSLLRHFAGDREAVRNQSVVVALEEVLKEIPGRD